MVSLVEVLPFEIIEHIVDILASYDYQEHKFQPTNIKACSLICRAFFQARSQRHLFRCVKIQESLSSAQLFAMLIITKPSIADYVRELCFVPGYPRPGEEVGTPFTQEHLVAFNSLVKLESLHIQAEDSSSQDWDTIHPSTRSMLLRLIRLPNIQSLGLTNISEFPALDIPKNSDKFKHLLLRDMQFDLGANTTSNESSLASLSTTTDSTSSLQTLQLHSLEIAGSWCIFSFHELLQARPGTSSPIIDLTNLHHITISFLGHKLLFLHLRETILAIFERSSLIETAHITFRQNLLREVVFWVTIVTQHSLNTLKELSLDVELRWPHENPYLGLCDVLQNMHGKNRIEVLKICVRLDNMREWGVSTGDEWGDLEKVVLAPGWSSALKELDLHIMIGLGPNAGLRDVLESLPLTQFPGLSSSSTVKFTFAVLPRVMPPGHQA